MPSQQLHSWIHRWNQQVPERKSFRPQKSNYQCHQKSHLHKTPKSRTQRFYSNRQREQQPYTTEQKKHFTFISRIHHSTETLAKSVSLQYSTNFSKLPDNYNFHIVLSPHPRGTPSSPGLFNTKDNLQFTPSWSPSTIEVSSLCSHLSNFQTTKP